MLTLQEIQGLMSGLVDWSLEGSSISKVFVFGSFKEGLGFLDKVGEICEVLEHWPDVVLSSGMVKLSLVGGVDGLEKKDFEVAGEIDKL